MTTYVDNNIICSTQPEHSGSQQQNQDHIYCSLAEQKGNLIFLVV